jgi:toxin FitB
LSEARLQSGDPGVRSALQNLADDDAYLASITIAEISKSIAKLPPSRRKSEFARWYGGLIVEYADRIIAFDTVIAEDTGRLAAEAERRGTPVPLADTIIAATARKRGLVVMTRNVRHFQMLGVPFFNPWSRA